MVTQHSTGTDIFVQVWYEAPPNISQSLSVHGMTARNQGKESSSLISSSIATLHTSCVLLSSEHQILFPTKKNATEANVMSKTVYGMMADQVYIKWDSSDGRSGVY
jgi:PHD/YefM family antitoxin component YafN of YafNO toxin-antitoxin module